MHFEMGGAVPAIHVSTYSTYYKTRSVDAPSYAAWYKPQEKPAVTDGAFHAQDDFTIELTDFRARFGKPRN